MEQKRAVIMFTKPVYGQYIVLKDFIKDFVEEKGEKYGKVYLHCMNGNKLYIEVASDNPTATLDAVTKRLDRKMRDIYHFGVKRRYFSELNTRGIG